MASVSRKIIIDQNKVEVNPLPPGAPDEMKEHIAGSLVVTDYEGNAPDQYYIPLSHDQRKHLMDELTKLAGMDLRIATAQDMPKPPEGAAP
jgi:hypothetical protein